jgi:uncharacterized membrane protein YqjE
VRALWSLPKAAPALLRHLAAYGELFALDIARAQREISASLIAALIAAFCVFFTLLFACVALIAYYWDTPHRVTAIAWLAGGFLIVAIGALLYQASLARRRSPFLADLKREWEQDRLLLEKILSGDEEPRS